jgi:hypothetical protein
VPQIAEAVIAGFILGLGIGLAVADEGDVGHGASDWRFAYVIDQGRGC